MNKNIILCGVGGQGTVLASRLISSSAMARSIPVLSAETIGMAQRGGSVFSHVRMSTETVLYSPMIARGEADLILGFEPGEAVRMLPFLKPDGQMVVSSRPVMPVTSALADTGYRAETMLEYLSSRVSRLVVVDAEKSPAGGRFPEGAESDSARRGPAQRRAGAGTGRPEGCRPAPYSRKIPRAQLPGAGLQALSLTEGLRIKSEKDA